ncbi:MAG: stage IV sporulation protein A [bacterium]|nr:stage IV sporulation protein A [bacterium]
MENENIIASLSKRAGGEIYLGVVGAVRTGKSTFIKRFIERLVVPNITDEYEKKKCLDEVPQSAQGKQIMTTEPKFVPSSGANIKVDEFQTSIKLVDCVGYVVKDATGFLDADGNPRMVKSPWYDDYIPLTEAAEIGTEKVIKDHATIGIVVTTDGSITEIDRDSYIEAEEKVIHELKEIGKPFIVILNSTHPDNRETLELAKKMEEEYNVPVIASSVDKVGTNELQNMLKTALYEFPVVNVNVKIPKWIDILKNDNEIKMHYIEKIKEAAFKVNKLKDVDIINNIFMESEYISKSYISNFDSSTGDVTITLESSDELFETVLKESIGNETITKSSLLNMFISFNENESELKNIKSAIKMAKNTGYGIMHPTLKDMQLSTPEIIKQGSRFGVKLKAKASSIHLIKVDVESTFEPIIGSEIQSKELIDYIMKDYENDKNSIWQSEIFGRSLEQIVKEGIEAKLAMMPDNARFKLANTVTKIVNKGANNLIAIVI